MPFSNLLAIYIPLLSWTGLGWLLGRILPAKAPIALGKFLFWIGVPIGIVAFLRHALISASLWIAPLAAWAAILLGSSLAWGWIQYGHPWIKQWFRKDLESDRACWNRKTQASFLLTSMVGNTGYIGFPVSLALVGADYFAWAIFYDMLGSTLGAYGLGVAVASRWGKHQTNHSWQRSLRTLFRTLLVNPALWGFCVGLAVRDMAISPLAEASLRGFAWSVVSLSLVLVGMRLSQLSSFNSIQPAAFSISIKMLLVPLVIGTGLWGLGVHGLVHRAILLQMAMPPAFATLVISEAYELDYELAVTAIAIGSLTLLLTLPLWLWLFGGYQ
ncbi:AEC family transporter [Phormidium sp. CLA17]|uniref:AEC family transporter n=1 Tax=Leptolyngbya sp. Cla-17 TaxID=2803751 RepID=UPI001490DDD3|nr:AEC family transporter [Leptolyngbya sp. Cla-17]MBM0743221.1 AEC family transporter [Leptolyngbya sp. Cla-17]